MRNLSAIMIFFLITCGGFAKNIGIYAGTFDPAHNSHIRLIETAITQLKLDQVIVLVNVQVPHKPRASSFKFRYQMAKLAFETIPNVQVMNSDLELTYDASGYEGVIDKILTQNPQDKIFSIYGSDILVQIRAAKVVPVQKDRLEQAVAFRVGYEEISVEQDQFSNFQFVTLQLEPNDLSSSLIRKSRVDSEFERNLPRRVYRFVKKHNLYLPSDSCANEFY